MTLKISDLRVLPGDSAFLVDDGKTTILYDSGFACTGDLLTEKIQKMLGDRKLNYIFLTHSHYDHVLGSAYVKRAYPKAQVVAAGYADYVFSRPSALKMMRHLDHRVAEKYNITHYEDLIDHLSVDVAVEDGDILHCGDMDVTVVAFPGHTKCSVGYYLPKEHLLLGVETHGVYFGESTYLPSYLVSYKETLASFQKAKELEIAQLLLPHYGLVTGEEATDYFRNAERVSVETADFILQQLKNGISHEEILSAFEEKTYHGSVRGTYPLDAYRLNTSIMINLIEKELL